MSLLRWFDAAPARVLGGALVALTALRVWGLTQSPLELHFDEAQYWMWSRTLEWGYFSKPPLIAWMIAATTALFSNAEWAVRLTAPIAHAIGAGALFLLARRMYGAGAGVWAGLLWITLPAVWLSSAIMSTDALMLPIWSIALYALWALIDTRRWSWAVLLGAALGLGVLAKYAMLYFLLSAALAALLSAEARRALLSPQGAGALALALLIAAPNLIWNAGHDFATLEHTAANANLGGRLFHPEELLEFLASQAGVIGPVLFIALIAALARAARAPKELRADDRFLIAFILPPLIIILAQALISRAHANWAAAAYPAAIVWLAGGLARGVAGRRTLIAALATHLALGGFVFAAGLNPTLIDRLGLADSTKRVRGWRASAHEIAARAAAQTAPVSAIMLDHRALYYELSYYWREELSAHPPLRMWLLHASAQSDAETRAPMRAADGARVLVVHYDARFIAVAQSDFARCTRLEDARIDLGGGEARPLAFSLCEGFQPVPRDRAFEARVRAL